MRRITFHTPDGQRVIDLDNITNADLNFLEPSWPDVTKDKILAMTPLLPDITDIVARIKTIEDRLGISLP